MTKHITLTYQLINSMEKLLKILKTLGKIENAILYGLTTLQQIVENKHWQIRF